jgi:hypothetical protein
MGCGVHSVTEVYRARLTINSSIHAAPVAPREAISATSDQEQQPAWYARAHARTHHCDALPHTTCLQQCALDRLVRLDVWAQAATEAARVVQHPGRIALGDIHVDEQRRRSQGLHHKPKQ